MEQWLWSVEHNVIDAEDSSPNTVARGALGVQSDMPALTPWSAPQFAAPFETSPFGSSPFGASPFGTTLLGARGFERVGGLTTIGSMATGVTSGDLPSGGVSQSALNSVAVQSAMDSMKTGPLSVLDSQLAALVIAQGPHATAMSALTSTVQQPSNAFLHDAHGTEYVVIDATAKNGNGAALLAKLDALGMQHGSSFGAMASGALPVDELLALTKVANLGHASESVYETHVGNATTQADAAEYADIARSTYGVDGTGFKVGVISDSFNTSGSSDTMATDITNGDLPANTTILQDDAGGTDEGRGMAQLVHDLAPGASIEFATADFGQAGFANNIIALANAGAKVIVDDVGYFAEPAYQDGVIAQAISQVTHNNGVTYFSSAGNDDNQGWEGAWSAGSTGTIASNAETFMQFAPGQEYIPVTLSGDDYFVLQWDQPAASADGGAHGSASDLDIELTDVTGHTLYAHATSNNIGGDPVEVMYVGPYAGDTLYLRVGLHSGPAPTEIKLMALDDGAGLVLGNAATDATNTNSGTTYGHPASEDAIGVAAAGYSDTPAFGTTPPAVEYFSSGGPTTIWYDTAGNRLTTPEILNHPQITAVDGGNTSFFGQDDGDADSLPNFYGTSAAAPDAAAVAVLMLQANSALTKDDLLNLLQDSAQDMGVAGYDVRTGSGLIRANLAVRFAKMLDITSDTLHGEALNGTHLADTIHPAFSNGVVNGEDGNDNIVFDTGALTASDQIDGGSGTDTVYLSSDYTGANALVLGATTLANVEGITVASGHSYNLTSNDATVGAGLTFTVDGTTLTASDSLTFNGSAENDGKFILLGGAGADSLTGGAGADTLNGGGGADNLIGGAGDDTYNIHNTGVTVTEAVNGGTDLVETDLASYTLSANVENLLYTGTGNFTGIGNTGTNTITGGAGSDQLNGGGGADTLAGGAGNDTYIVNNTGVTVTEGASAGTDTVETSLTSYTLGANLENLTYTGSSNFTGTGNTLVNTITGSTGNDTLSGNGGADHLIGGGGNDTYIVNNTGVTVTEGASAGTDTVKTSLASYTLGANLENLTYTGSSNFTGTGNTLANTITGGAGNDTIVSGTGTDIVNGGGGNDTIGFSGNALTAADKVDGGTGTDTVTLGGNYTGTNALVLSATTMVNVEALKLSAGDSYSITTNSATVASGATLSVNASALDATHTLSFNGAAETNGHFVITGGLGADKLTGGSQSDTFVYTSAAQSSSTHFDTINGFHYANDKFNVAGTISKIDTAVSHALSTATFNTDLAAATSGHLVVHSAMLVTASAGTLKGDVFLVIDQNGAAGYQTGHDLVIELHAAVGTLATTDFI